MTDQQAWRQVVQADRTTNRRTVSHTNLFSERSLVCLCLSVCLSFVVCLPLCLFVYVCRSLFFCRSACLPARLSLSLSLSHPPHPTPPLLSLFLSRNTGAMSHVARKDLEQVLHIWPCLLLFRAFRLPNAGSARAAHRH